MDLPYAERTTTMDEPVAARVAYDRIAAHFSLTREHPWPEVETFLSERSGNVSLDLGCGNGRHAEVLAERSRRTVGIDASRAMLEEARSRARDRRFSLDLLVGDVRNVPLSADTVDLAVYVATIHHLSSRTDRIRSLDELARVLHPDGRALVSAWSTDHERFDEDRAFDTYLDWTLPDGETVSRFYHIYSPSSFERELAASTLVPLETFVSSGNCYAVVGTEAPV